LKVKDLVRRKPLTIEDKATLIEAAQKMIRENVGLLVIVDPKSGTPVAVISERDILRAFSNKLPAETNVLEVATKHPIMVGLDEDVGSAATKMVNNKIRHLVVVDSQGKLAGVLSIRDLVAERSTLKAIASSHEYEPLAGGD